MADIKWIKITTDIFSDEKIMLIEEMPEADTILVIWFKLLCMAGRDNNNGIFLMNNKIPYTEEMFSTLFRRPLNTVRLAIATFEAFGMIEIMDGVFTLPNWEKHQNIDGMEKIREQTRQRVAKYREKQKQLTCNVTVTCSNATDKEEDKEKDKDKEKKKRYARKSPKEDSTQLFDRLRTDYNFNEDVEDKMREWISYKTERNESYQEQGMKTLLRRIETNATKYGGQAVCDLIDDSMSNGWKGIIFDRLKNAPKKEQTTESYIDMWRNA